MAEDIKVTVLENPDSLPKQPDVLYKYRRWDNKGKGILTDNKIFLSSPKDFEDNLDCNVPEKYPTKDELPEIFMKKSQEINKGASRQVHRKWVRDMLKSSPLANPKLLEKLVAEFNLEFNNRFGVLSVTENPNNTEMWTKYADNSKGICIGLRSDLLFNVVGGGGEVIYRETLPEIDFIEDDNTTKIMKNIMFKENKWAFEQEYRLHKMWESNIESDVRNVLMVENTIVEVILGKDMSTEEKNEVKDLIAKHQPQAKIIELS